MAGREILLHGIKIADHVSRVEKIEGWSELREARFNGIRTEGHSVEFNGRNATVMVKRTKTDPSLEHDSIEEMKPGFNRACSRLLRLGIFDNCSSVRCAAIRASMIRGDSYSSEHKDGPIPRIARNVKEITSRVEMRHQLHQSVFVCLAHS